MRQTPRSAATQARIASPVSLVAVLLSLGCVRGSCNPQTRCDADDAPGDSAPGDSATDSGQIDCDAIDAEEACREQHECDWLDLYALADVDQCLRENQPGRCLPVDAIARPYPVTYVDPSGTMFVDVGVEDCTGQLHAPAGWTRCTLDDASPPGCACTWIDGVEAGRRAAEHMSTCSVDGDYFIEIELDERQECDEVQARPIVEALASGHNVHIHVRRNGFLYLGNVHVYGAADRGFVLLENAAGDSGGCVRPEWVAPLTCATVDRAYFQAALDKGMACRVIESAATGWGSTCTGGAVECSE